MDANGRMMADAPLRILFFASLRDAVGIAELTLSDNPTTDEVNKRAHDAIKKILDQYPPQ